MPILSVAPIVHRGLTARCALALALIGGAMGSGCSTVTHTVSRDDGDGGSSTAGTPSGVGGEASNQGGSATGGTPSGVGGEASNQGGSATGGTPSGVGGEASNQGGSATGGTTGAGGQAGSGATASGGGTTPTSCNPTLAPNLHASCIEDLGDSKLRITYDFENSEQLRDFGMSADGTMDLLVGSLVLTCNNSNYCAALFRDPLLVHHATVVATPVAGPDVIVSLNTVSGGMGFGCYGDRSGLGFAFDQSEFEQAQAVPTRVGTRYTINVTQTTSTLTCDFNGVSYSGEYVLVPTTNRIFALAGWSSQVAFDSLVLEAQLNVR